MSYFKKFTDFCAGVAAFVAALFLIRHYMEFVPSNTDEGAPSKLSQFIENSASTDYSMIISMVFLLCISVLISIIFRKLPYVCFSFSIIPAVFICFMFQKELLYEQELLFLAASLLHVVGNLAECIFKDKEDGGHRLFIASKISFLMGWLICLYMVNRLNETKPTSVNGLNTFQKELFFYKGGLDSQIISTLGWMLLIFLAVSLLLYNVYFVDALLSVVSFTYIAINVAFEKLTFLPLVFICVVSICAISNVLLAVFENNLSKKEQQRLF